MVIDVLRLLVWLAGLALVAMIEHTTGLPILTLMILVLAVAEESLVWYGSFAFLSALLVASLYLESLLVVWILFVVLTSLWRSPLFKIKKAVAPRFAMLLLGSVVLSLLQEPTVTIAFVIHSIASAMIAGYIIWRKIKPKTKSLDIADLRFISES